MQPLLLLELLLLLIIPSKIRCLAGHQSSIKSSVNSNRANGVIRLNMSSSQTPTSTQVLASSLKGCVNMALSVDGMIAGKHGDMDWLNHHPPPTDDAGDMGFADFLASVDVMIMGRNTFDTVVGFGKDMWPYGQLPILVWTRDVSKVLIPDWIQEKNSVTARSAASPEALWKELERCEEYNRVYIDGGKTIQSFLEAGLIHEFKLTRVPILLGEGTPLFSGNDSSIRKLRHVSTTSYDNGMVTSTYVIQ